MRAFATVALAAAALTACAPAQGQAESDAAERAAAQGYERAIFAGGCFWCIEADFEHLDGVIDAVSGYTGGTLENPGYYDVVRGDTGHYEAVEVVFDPDAVSYETLLSHYWRNIDPTDVDGQFCDQGSSYRTAIFVTDEDQRSAAEASIEELEASGRFNNIATQILDAGPFYVAEERHQNYYIEYAERYAAYRRGCRRDARLEQLWGDEAGGESGDH